MIISSGVTARIQNAFRRKAESVIERGTENLVSLLAVPEEEYRIGILTALPKESAAIRAVFGDGIALPSSERHAIEFREIPYRSNEAREHRLALCQCVRMGNNSAAVAAAILLYEYPSIRNIIMVGIAGGVPHARSGSGEKESFDDHVRLGDIVVSGEAVIQYDMIKLRLDNHENRSTAPPPSGQLMAAVAGLEEDAALGQRSWEEYIEKGMARMKVGRPWRDELYEYEITEKNGVRQLDRRIHHPRQRGRRKGKPFVHRGRIGSANIVLKNPRRRDELRREHNIRAVEMEGSGVADAAWSFSVGYLVVRGICDYCDMRKNDRWQKYAAIAAAAYTRAIVEKIRSR